MLKNITKSCEILCVSLSLLFFLPVTPTDAKLQELQKTYEWSNQFTCGARYDARYGVVEDDVLMSFKNTNSYPVILKNYMKMHGAEGGDAGSESRYYNVIMIPQQTLEFTCGKIQRILFQGLPYPDVHPSFEISLFSQSLLELEYQFYQDSGVL